MEWLFIGAVACAVVVVSAFFHAGALLIALRALGLGGQKATFRRCLAFWSVLTPLWVAGNVLARAAFEARGIGAGVALCTTSVVFLPVYALALRKSFDLIAADTAVLILVLNVSLFLFGLALALAIGVVVTYPLVALGLAAPFAFAWVSRSRRNDLARRLNAAVRG